MRAYRFDRLNGLDDLTLHEAPAPAPQRGEVLVRVRAVSLNSRDIAIPLGRYVWNVKPGLIPCSDAAGDVVAVGEDVSAFRAGDRVVSAYHPRWFGGRPLGDGLVVHKPAVLAAAIGVPSIERPSMTCRPMASIGISPVSQS
jgi:NADPH:quinone reductase-like Zn-dependent oxidoreductase